MIFLVNSKYRQPLAERVPSRSSPSPTKHQLTNFNIHFIEYRNMVPFQRNGWVGVSWNRTNISSASQTRCSTFELTPAELPRYGIQSFAYPIADSPLQSHEHCRIIDSTALKFVQFEDMQGKYCEWDTRSSEQYFADA